MKKENKTESILIRLTPTEKQELQEKASAAHMSVSGYLAKLSADKKIVRTENAAKLIYEISKIGTNINQIVHVANGQHYVYKEELQTIQLQMDAITELTQKILKAMYDDNEYTLKTLERKIEKLTERVEEIGDNKIS